MQRPSRSTRTARRRAARLAAATLLAAGSALSGVSEAGAAVRLNEVQYDPLGEDAGAEFVELWNDGDVGVPLEGFRLEAGDGARPGLWSVVFAGAPSDTARARSPFLVEGARLTGPLQNGPDALRLTDDVGAPLDLLGWGALDDPSQYERSPAPDVDSGASLARREDGVDRDSNADDWEAAEVPTPGRPNRPARAVRFSRPAVLTPEVVWPGEECAVSLEATNSGREPLPAGSWRIAISVGARSIGGMPEPPVESAVLEGPALAPGERVVSNAAFVPSAATGTWEGLFDVLAVASVDAPDPASPPDSTRAAGRVGASPIAVNEFAYRDAGAGEWVELLALEDVPAWSAFALGDASGSTRRLRATAGSGGAGSGAIRVAVADPARFLARFPLPESLLLTVEGGWLSLNDAAPSSSAGAAWWADAVRVADAAGAPCDAVPYGAAWSARGGSLERLSSRLPSASPHAWTETASPEGGTPGGVNSIAAPGLDRPASLPLLGAPSRVLRRGGGGGGALVLEIGAAAAGLDVRLSILDLRGRTRRVLADGVRFGGAGALAWDGRDAGGAPLPPGLYLARLEAVSPSGGAPRRASVAIAVAP